MDELSSPDIWSELASSYLMSPSALSIHTDTEKQLEIWDRAVKPQQLLHVEEDDFRATSFNLNFKRDATGNIISYEETEVNLQETATNSAAMTRAPGDPSSSIRGRNTYVPFWPAGFSEDDDDEVSNDDDQDNEDDFDLLTCPPGFEHGYDFGTRSEDVKETTVDLTSLLLEDISLNLLSSSEKSKDEKIESAESVEEEVIKDEDVKLLEQDLVVNQSVLSISEQSNEKEDDKSGFEWATMLDISKPIIDFHSRLPQMAFVWPFELDTFQKAAVLLLENNESVFVAAHTSAGKTVVAEYAIALSQKHLTRTIYTSPIKALSNQKYRDFKATFGAENVGLITGDIQINATATCLIMTTEILRSMLYNGSDLIRDLEFVVFDEVHYINDSERGVVWEESLILLPDHVNLILLSATVPNTMHFAEWVGSTKRRRIHVITTLSRPVPLEHFLYTGSNAKSSEELFLIQSSDGQFVQEGHKKAVAAKKARQKAAKSGPKGVNTRVGPQQEKNIWITLVNYLDKRDKLPVVAFTLSRNRCDQNAALLTSLDLTTAVEKSDIHHFISRCVQRLKGSDRRLPQVLTLTELLKRGIGVHHSGVLPILKEMVEMLFQNGWVKLLFATETFAMGVNMPARTVVFDSIEKHDGIRFRVLRPAEYIQMAGRAGRRGLDTTGTVIILCKNEPYELSDLVGMMQGRPTQLESKFRLTYTMILNLLRVEQMRVEDMMKRSFSEIDNQKKQANRKLQLDQLRKQLRDEEKRNSDVNNKELINFYHLALQHEEIRSSLWPLLLAHSASMKILMPGRFVLINHEHRFNVPGILLRITDAKNNDICTKKYTVLIRSQSQSVKKPWLEVIDSLAKESVRQFVAFLSLSSKNLEQSELDAGVVLVDVESFHLMRMMHGKLRNLDMIKLESEADKLQLPRFKGSPLGPNLASALRQLNDYIESGIECLDETKDLKINDLDMISSLQTLMTLRSSVNVLERLKGSADFGLRLAVVFHQRKLQEQVDNLQYLLSEASLSHLPDYHMRLEVLRRLRYIDTNNNVQLKGRVACEMGSRELIITELILDNVLTQRMPAEIAALLSALVFQQKRCSPPNLNDNLKGGVADVERAGLVVTEAERACGLNTSVLDDQINFGLVEVVYEWARGMPFSQITELTDVQEGVIVRTIQRLDEALRDVKDAARVIGDPVLYQKMDEASSAIKRDIVFAASLYTQ